VRKSPEDFDAKSVKYMLTLFFTENKISEHYGQTLFLNGHFPNL